MVVSLPRGSPGPRYKTVDLDYETSGRTVKPGAELRPVLPRIGMPCLSFCWELVTPPCWQARSYGPGLLPSDPELLRSGPLVHWGFRNCAGPAGNQHAHGLRRNTSPARRNPGRHVVRGALLRRVVHPVGFGDDATDHRPPGPQSRRSWAQVSVHPESRGPQGTASLPEDPSAIRAHPFASIPDL